MTLTALARISMGRAVAAAVRKAIGLPLIAAAA
jgi:hypothetical protein